MHVRKAVFPAAGLGTRFLPATKAQPKEMLPLVDKPTIQYVVEEAVASGLSDIIIVTGRGKRAIEDHFDAAFELEYYLADRGKTEELEQIRTMQRNQRYPRHSYDLPGLLEEAADERYRVRASGIRMVQQGGRFGLVREGSRAATEVPADVSAMVGWVLERQQFSRDELARAFPERQPAQLESLLRDLGAMRLTEPIV